VSFDNNRVQTYIDKAMADNTNFKPIGNQLEMAWSQLYMQREKEDPKCDNEELAAAEHYMYARWQVATGKTWEWVMVTRTFGYDVAKLLGYVPVILLIRKALGHSWVWPSTSSISWGLDGCNHGAQDKAAECVRQKSC
jgi:hypothetical protein